MHFTDYWWIEALLGFVALAAIQYGIKKIISRAEKLNKEGWKARVGKIFRPPLSTLLWVLAALYAIDVIGDQVGFSIAVRYLGALRKTAVVGSSAWIFFRWKNEFEHALLTSHSTRVDLTTIKVVGRLATIGASIITGLIILQIFGVNIAPLLAFGSIGAASLGFASKDVIANFCSGIMLYVTRPFVIGDQIYLPEKDLEGKIEEIGWFRTSIRDKEKRAVYLPNNFFSTLIVVNISRMTHRRIKHLLKIGFKDVKKISEIVDEMRKHLERCPHIDQQAPLQVFLKSFGDYACEIEIEAYSTVIDQAEFNQLQHQILLELESILKGMGVTLALPAYQWIGEA